MLPMSEAPKRSRPTHGVKIIDSNSTIIYLTVCTKNRVPWLASEITHDLIRRVWHDAQAWLVGRYVLMPDHLHLFAGWTGSDITLDAWVRYWKSQFTKAGGQPQRRWQTDHWDTRMRTARQFEEKWEYVRNNPVRHGLVKRPDEWPFQGQIFDWQW